MRVDNVNTSKGIGYLKYNSEAEMDLIAEAMDLLVDKQQRLVDKEGRKDREDNERLARFKKCKNNVVDFPRQHKDKLKNVQKKMKDRADNIHGGHGPKVDVEDTEEFKNAARVIADAEVDSGLREGTEVTRRDMFVLASALNELIWDMEKRGIHKRTTRNKVKYQKLWQLLEETQEQKTKFKRVTPKPKGWGRLRR